MNNERLIPCLRMLRLAGVLLAEMRRMYWVSSAFMVLVVLMSSGRASAQPGTDRFVPFNEFTATTAAAAFSPSTGKVANAAAFEEMRQHILKMYEGVQVSHSFTVGSQTYDCMPIEQQPAVRLLGLKGIATPPPPSAASASGAAGLNGAGQQPRQPVIESIVPSGVDRFGNTIGCEDKTVPIGRTTLEQMSQFPTLQAFLRKSPDGKGKPPVPALKPGSTPASSSDGFIDPSPVEHQYNVTYQSVYNLGGTSTLSVNMPYVETKWGEVFSLSQVWFIGYKDGQTQTVEAGWQVYPDRLYDQWPHLFAYYTADGYTQTGCYDYTCGAFLQTSGSTFLGAALWPSLPGGTQYEKTIKWEWWSGNWWLQVSGTWVGYYPGSLFGGGEMATHSVLIEFGGEIVGGDGTPYNYYPPMGSGYWGTDGWPWAAFQHGIYYYDDADYAHPADMVPDNTCPAKSSIFGPYWYSLDEWQIYFYFGGPGGYCW